MLPVPATAKTRRWRAILPLALANFGWRDAASSVMNVRRLEPSDVALVASIDRSEHVEVQYRIEDGRLKVEGCAIGICQAEMWGRTK